MSGPYVVAISAWRGAPADRARYDGRNPRRRFYLRRTFWIFPPYYASILALAVADLARWITLAPGDVFHTVTHTSNYHASRSWNVGHTYVGAWWLPFSSAKTTSSRSRPTPCKTSARLDPPRRDERHRGGRFAATVGCTVERRDVIRQRNSSDRCDIKSGNRTATQRRACRTERLDHA